MISFIIPAYNAEDKIEKCIESIVGQKTEEQYEVVVVNDGSSDNTSDIVKKCIERYQNVRLIEKKNGGVSSARNAGIEQCQGEFIVFLDADDCLEARFFDKIIGYSSYELTVYGYNYIVGDRCIPVLSEEHEEYDIEKCFLELYEKRLFNPVWNKIYKKSLIKRLFEHDFSIGEDLLFNIEYMRNIKNVNIISDVLYNYTITVGSITQSYKENYARNFTDCYITLKQFKKEIGTERCSCIEKDYIDNLVGTITLLAGCKRYQYAQKLEQIENIRKIVCFQHIIEKKNHNYNGLIIALLRKKHYHIIFSIVNLKKNVKLVLEKIKNK